MDKSIRLLHVDDASAFAEVTSTALERESERLSVETAANASEGLDRLSAESFDCVVSDYEMPDENGIAFLRAVRETYPDLPFILFTGNGSEEIASDAISAGATDYLPKSTTDQYTLLANRVENAVEQYRESQRRRNLERVRRIVNEVNQALVRASSRDEIESATCDIMAEAYDSAIHAGVDAESGVFDPRTWCGQGEQFFEAIEIPVSEGSPTALEDSGVTIVSDIAAEPTASWQEAALEHGVRSLATVPLEYDDDAYGYLLVFAESSHAFDETERELLAELGDDISHAIAAIEAREALRTEKERFRLLAESAQDVIVTIDADSEIQFANAAVQDVFGYPPTELVGEPLTMLMPEGFRGRHEDAIEEYLRTGERTLDWSYVELPGLRKDGTRRTLGISFSKFEHRGEPCFEGIIRDVTEKKRREQDLETYETIVETIQDGIYALNGDAEFVVVNDAFADLLGYDSEELLGSHVSRVRPAELAGTFDDIQDALDDGSGLESIEMEVEAADGSTRAIDARYGWFPNGDGKPGRVGVWRDVTEKREREQTLEQYREYTERVFDSIDDLFFAVDEEGRPQRWNDALVEVSGYSEEEIASMHALEFLPEDYRNLAAAVLEKGFETGHARLEAPLLTSDGQEIPYEYTADRVAHPDGEPRLVGVGRDISERVQQEEELRRHNERLSEFANIVSHDLRNPLNVADGRIELARDECESEHLDAAKSAIERSHALIEELLSLARAGEQAGDPEPVDIERAVSECWRNVPTAEATIRTECSRTVRADRSRLEQLLENLIRNAVEHGREDVTITVGSLDDGFYVADDGPGIPPDLREDVFEPGQSTADDGTGYGLAIVEQVADAHGWEVHLTESESNGARFEFIDVDTS